MEGGAKQKSTRLTHLILGTYVLQIWSRYPLAFDRNKTLAAHCVAPGARCGENGVLEGCLGKFGLTPLVEPGSFQLQRSRFCIDETQLDTSRTVSEPGRWWTWSSLWEKRSSWRVVVRRAACGIINSSLCEKSCGGSQGYHAHKKLPTFLGLPKGPRHRRTLFLMSEAPP